MKTFLVTVSAFGLMASAAFAECAGHPKSASIEVDKSATTSNISQKAELASVAGKPPVESQETATE